MIEVTAQLRIIAETDEEADAILKRLLAPVPGRGSVHVLESSREEFTR